MGTQFSDQELNLHPLHWKHGFPTTEPPEKSLLFLFFFFLIITILTVVGWYLIVDLICISLLISNGEHLLCIYWLFACLLWKNVYSGPLLILNCVCVRMWVFCFLFVGFRPGLVFFICFLDFLIFIVAIESYEFLGIYFRY